MNVLGLSLWTLLLSVETPCAVFWFLESRECEEWCRGSVSHHSFSPVMLLVTLIRLSEDRDRMGAVASHETKCSSRGLQNYSPLLVTFSTAWTPSLLKWNDLDFYCTCKVENKYIYVQVLIVRNIMHVDYCQPISTWSGKFKNSLFTPISRAEKQLMGRVVKIVKCGVIVAFKKLWLVYSTPASC